MDLVVLASNPTAEATVEVDVRTDVGAPSTTVAGAPTPTPVPAGRSSAESAAPTRSTAPGGASAGRNGIAPTTWIAIALGLLALVAAAVTVALVRSPSARRRTEV